MDVALKRKSLLECRVRQKLIVVEKVPVVGRRPFSKRWPQRFHRKNRPLVSTSTEKTSFKKLKLEVYVMIMDFLDTDINCLHHNVCSLCRMNARSKFNGLGVD